ncbi:cytochrome P450 4C1-like isoform X1 [Rhodnius prolixus]|uniref:Putative p450 enzyme n=2 Tax=Rhodnius prolixus TaxID=13249 RepID=R4FNU8_RHOPR
MLLELVLLLLTIISLMVILLVPLADINLRPKTIRKMSKLPGPRLLPLFIGFAYKLVTLAETEMLQYLTSLHQDFPRMAAIWIIGIPEVLLFDPDDLEVIMGNIQHIQKGLEYYFLIPWLKEGLLLSNGEKWHQRRKLLTPAFHFKILEDSMQSLNKHSRLLLRNMLNRNGEPFFAEEMIIPCTLDIICETAMGHSLNSQENSGNTDYLKAVKSACNLMFRRCVKLIYGNEWIYACTVDGRNFHKDLNYLHTFSENIIRKRKMNYLAESQYSAEKSIEEENFFNNKKKKAFLDILIETDRKTGNTFSDKDIREEVDTFMFEGHDTTSTCIQFALYLLGRNPHVQEKAYEELHEIFGDSDRAATNKDVHEMHYLEMIIKETLRLYPSVPYISRLLTQDLQLKDDTVIPKGANVCIIPFILHRDSKYFPNPEVFDPERFTVDNCKKRHPYAYIPFSAGPRNCIGQKFAMMELKVVLSTILRFAKIESVNEIDDTKLIPSALLRSKDPIQIKLISRD